MRRIVLLAALVIGAFSQSAAQASRWGLSSLSFGSGEDPITSGIGITANFSKMGSPQVFEVAFQNEQAWLGIGRTFAVKTAEGRIDATVGHFQGAPWFGPRLTIGIPIVQKMHLGLISWPGIFAWKPKSFEDEDIKHPLTGPYNGVSLTKGPLTLSYTFQKFLNTPANELPGVAYTMKINDNFSASASGTYNRNDARWMFYIGAGWTVARPAAAAKVAGK